MLLVMYASEGIGLAAPQVSIIYANKIINNQTNTNRLVKI